MANFPTAFNKSLVKPLLIGHARSIWIGDSYAVPNSRNRLPMAWLQAGKMKDNRPMAVWMASTGNGSDNTCFSFTNHTGGTGSYVNAEEAVNDWAIGSGEFYALPLRYAGTIQGLSTLTLGATITGDHKKAVTYELVDSSFDLGNNGRLTSASEQLKARFCFYATAPQSDNTPNAVKIYDSAAALLAAPNLRLDNRQYWHLGGNPDSGISLNDTANQDINAYYQDLTLPLGSSKVDVALDESNMVGPDRYYCPAGILYHRSGATGYYHSAMADVSWSYSGMATDAATAGGGEKTYSNDQLVHWLDVTTLDRAQPVYVILHIADESLTKSQIKTHLQNTRSRWQTVAARDHLP